MDLIPEADKNEAEGKLSSGKAFFFLILVSVILSVRKGQYFTDANLIEYSGSVFQNSDALKIK